MLRIIPSQYNPTQLESLKREAGFSDATVSTSKELEEIFTYIYFKFFRLDRLFKVIVKCIFKSSENENLSLFYLIIPTLTLNLIEKMLISKVQIGKKNSTTEMFIGVNRWTYIIRMMVLLFSIYFNFIGSKSKSKLEKKDMKQAIALAIKKPNQSQGGTDEVNQICNMMNSK